MPGRDFRALTGDHRCGGLQAEERTNLGNLLGLMETHPCLQCCVFQNTAECLQGAEKCQVSHCFPGEGEREGGRETGRQTDRQRKRKRQRGWNEMDRGDRE